MSEENKTSTTDKAMQYEPVLTPVILEAIGNDIPLKQMNDQLNKLHQTAIPKVIQYPNGDIVGKFDDEFNELVAKIHEQIKLRQQQIIDAYSNGR